MIAMAVNKIFVFVPGAWTGDWVWNQVAERLRARGHVVHSLTLPGLDGDNQDAGLSDHVQAVLSSVGCATRCARGADHPPANPVARPLLTVPAWTRSIECCVER
jgi:hypothetical protein